MTLGERIYAQRAARNLPQAALAEALGVSRQSVSKWETDASVPDLDKLVGLCELFEISMDELVRGEEPAEEAPPPEETPPPAASETRPVRNPLTVRVAVGLGLIFLGALVFVLGLLYLGEAPAGLILASPFLLCGAACLVFKGHPALACGWILWGGYTMFLSHATGVKPHWVISPAMYMGLGYPTNVYAVLAWSEALLLLALLARTGWVIYRRVKKKLERPGA